MEFSDAEMERYSRQIILREMGGLAQVKLKQARVLVIGAGGLGAPLLSYLAGAGVGHITVADGDVVERSNLQRQTLFTDADIGRQKAEVAALRLRAVNPDIRVEAHAERVTLETVDSLIGDHTLVADGSDNFTTRLLVSDAAVRARVTLVSAAVNGFEGQLATFKPHVGNNPCYRCFVPQHPGEAAERTCSDMGVIGPAVGMLGSMQAFEVIRECAEIGSESGREFDGAFGGRAGGSLAGSILLVDLMRFEVRRMRLPRDPACLACGQK